MTDILTELDRWWPVLGIVATVFYGWGIYHLSRSIELQHTSVGWSDGYDCFQTLFQIAFDALKVAGKCFCILGTDFKTTPTVDTVIHHDTCLLVPDRYGFHCTVADTFVAVTASGVFKINDLHSVTLLSFSFSIHISHN